MELMWSRVAEALDPSGNGHYDVEYRVKQLDGSWRWLSAWGLVEFDGDGPARKSVAIAGASRELTKLKQGEELQRLLLNELNHASKTRWRRSRPSPRRLCVSIGLQIDPVSASNFGSDSLLMQFEGCLAL